MKSTHPTPLWLYLSTAIIHVWLAQPEKAFVIHVWPRWTGHSCFYKRKLVLVSVRQTTRWVMECVWSVMIHALLAMRLIWITVLHALAWFIRFCSMENAQQVVRILCMETILPKNAKHVSVHARRVRIQRLVLLVFSREHWISCLGLLVWHRVQWTQLCW